MIYRSDMKKDIVTHQPPRQSGFTLLEVLLVVALIGVLAGIVIVAINPGKQLGETNNAQRKLDVNTIITAVYQYRLDNGGNIPTAIDNATGTSQVLGTDSSGCDNTCTATAAATETACLNMTSDLVPTYIVGIPTDPSSGSPANTDYYINQTDDGRITVGACDPEQGATISVSR